MSVRYCRRSPYPIDGILFYSFHVAIQVQSRDSLLLVDAELLSTCQAIKIHVTRFIGYCLTDFKSLSRILWYLKFSKLESISCAGKLRHYFTPVMTGRICARWDTFTTLGSRTNNSLEKGWLRLVVVIFPSFHIFVIRTFARLLCHCPLTSSMSLGDVEQTHDRISASDMQEVAIK